VLNDVRRDTITWAGIKKHCVLKKKYIALYKKAVGQEAGGGTVEDGTKTRLAALEADMDGMEGWMAHDGQWTIGWWYQAHVNGTLPSDHRPMQRTRSACTGK
jgi:hypothetical protein